MFGCISPEPVVDQFFSRRVSVDDLGGNRGQVRISDSADAFNEPSAEIISYISSIVANRLISDSLLTNLDTTENGTSAGYVSSISISTEEEEKSDCPLNGLLASLFVVRSF